MGKRLSRDAFMKLRHPPSPPPVKRGAVALAPPFPLLALPITASNADEWVRQAAVSKAQEAVAMIERVMRDGGRHSRVQLAAAKELLDRAVGTPHTEVRTTGPGGAPLPAPVTTIVLAWGDRVGVESGPKVVEVLFKTE